jgi:phospholipase C
MAMTIIPDSMAKSFCFVLIASILSILFLITHLLIEYSNMNAYGISSSSEVKTKTPIKHIIVISQGKRSFDNYFGTFPHANGFPSNLKIPADPYPLPTVKFSLSVWFKTNNTLLKNGFLVNKGGLGVDTPGKNMNYGIWMNTKGNIIAGFETKDGIDYKVSSNESYNDGNWHNAIVTYDGNSLLSLFLDGSLTMQNQTNGAIPQDRVSQPIRIGANSLHLGNYFTGLLDKVSIWDRALTYPEILKVYNNTYDKNGQLVYLSFSDSKKNESAYPTSRSNLLNGVYMNGSSYYDIKNDSLQQVASVRPFHLETTKTNSPYDDSRAYKTSHNNGKMNGFVFAQTLKGNDPNLVMGYYDGREIPYYWQFALEFVLADNFFAPTMETGLANHQYLYTANSLDYPKNVPFHGYLNLNKTIFDELEHSGLSWKVYVKNYNPALNYSNSDVTKNRYLNLMAAIPRFVDNKTLNSNIMDLVEYYRDLRSDHFPAVSYIVAPQSDESSPKNISAGQEFATSLVLSLMKSKHWNDSVFIITYREPGGWYDHVKPPVVNGQKYGFRVPTLIISPFAKKGYVDSTVYDVTSILKFIEYNFGMSALSTRDANANNILNAFNFTQAPRNPPILYHDSTQNAINDTTVFNIKNGESIDKVKLAYTIALALIPSAFLAIWLVNRRRAGFDFVRKSGF